MAHRACPGRGPHCFSRQGSVRHLPRRCARTSRACLRQPSLRGVARGMDDPLSAFAAEAQRPALGPRSMGGSDPQVVERTLSGDGSTMDQSDVVLVDIGGSPTAEESRLAGWCGALGVDLSRALVRETSPCLCIPHSRALRRTTSPKRPNSNGRRTPRWRRRTARRSRVSRTCCSRRAAPWRRAKWAPWAAPWAWSRPRRRVDAWWPTRSRRGSASGPRTTRDVRSTRPSSRAKPRSTWP